MNTGRYFLVGIIAFITGYGLGIGRSNDFEDNQPQSVSIEKISKEITLDTQWIGFDEFVLFDTAVEEAYRKTGFEKSFDDFKVPVYKGVKAAINYRSNPIIREYKTRITGDYEREAVNFAGHYVLASWMCGAPCQDFALVDVLTGKAYPGIIATSGYDFRKNSRLLIVNPPDSAGWYHPMHRMEGVPEYYLWSNNQFKRLDY